MKILYDHQTFTLQKYGGISRYFYELIKNFNKEKDINIDMPLLFSDNYYIQDKKDIDFVNFFPTYEFRGKYRLIDPINKLISISKIKKQDFDLFHPTYYDPYFLNYIGDKPFVLTVYDMIHEKFNDMFVSNDKSDRKKLLVTKASKIIAISESTKKDLMELFDVRESKIEVVYLGNSMVMNDNIVIDIKIPEKYILFIGSRKGYKNFDRFIHGASKLLSNDCALSIVCVGGGKFSKEEIFIFRKLNINDQILQFNITDDLLAHFYKKAEMFVFPSLYEGFGIPVLEAFACECPLVCSDSSSLPEIAQNGAIYFDPYCETSIYNAMKLILESDEKKKILIKNGIERLKYFSWEKTAKQTKQVYESVIK